MKLKTIILLFGYLCCNYSVAQAPTPTKTKLEKIADSIYFNKTESYSADDYKTMQDLRRQIISKYIDTSSINYKLKDESDNLYLDLFYRPLLPLFHFLQ